MEGKGRLDARNWEFSHHSGHSGSVLDTGLGPGASSMEFPWFQHKGFISKDSSHSTHQDEEVNDAKPAKAKKPRGSSRTAAKAIRPKEPKKRASVPRKKKGPSESSGTREKRNQDETFEGEMLDFSGVPAPVCSCTGVARQCYRWGAGGWQSSCCTTSISEYPLPMSSTRPGARLAGRKMSVSAYAKLLNRLASEGYDLSYAVDLKDHWARHGTNKFVMIR